MSAGEPVSERVFLAAVAEIRSDVAGLRDDFREDVREIRVEWRDWRSAHGAEHADFDASLSKRMGQLVVLGTLRYVGDQIRQRWTVVLVTVLGLVVLLGQATAGVAR